MHFKSNRLASMHLKSMDKSWLTVQGESLRTWSFQSPAVEQVQVVLSTAGGPLEAILEVWQGPHHEPVSMRIYGEDGKLRHFRTVLATPHGPNTVSLRNIGKIVWPISAKIRPDNVDHPSPQAQNNFMFVQGGSLRTFAFDSRVDLVEVLLSTNGRPLNARLELLQGPNSEKQVVELYTEDGVEWPCFFILDTPGSGNVVRVVNTGSIAFPMYLSVVPHSLNTGKYPDDVVIGGDR